MDSTRKIWDKVTRWMKRAWSTMLKVWNPPTVLAVGSIFATFLLFDVFWCYGSTFRPFSGLFLYVTGIFMSLFLALPYILTRRIWTLWVVLLLLDVLLLSNLMYYRTYSEAIPLGTYLLGGNLRDFMPAVWASLRWADLSFLALTVTAMLLYWHYIRGNELKKKEKLWGYFAWMCIPLIIYVSFFPTPSSFRKSYASDASSAYEYRTGPAKYTVFGKMYYDALIETEHITSAQVHEVRDFARNLRPVPMLPDSIAPRRNLVIVICESLESWGLGLRYEGHEVTPHLNSLLSDASTLYAPKMLSQAKGGRSIDGQLLYLTGMLPLEQGCFSSNYPGSNLPSIHKALKEGHGAHSYLLTGDKKKVWNQEGAARAMGIDTIIDYEGFRIEDNYAKRRHVGDRALIRQIIEKMRSNSIWPVGEAAIVQIITFSGHSPFKMPEQERDWILSEDTPETLAGYLYCAHYTDKAIGELTDYLKGRPDWENTLFVIAGDHEGLGQRRQELANSPKGKGVVNENPYVPLIIANSPIGGRIEQVIGQCDMYPTLLQLLGLQGYWWPGFGVSVLSNTHPRCATDPWGKLYGTPTDAKAQGKQRKAQIISDRIIRFNLFGH